MTSPIESIRENRKQFEEKFTNEIKIGSSLWIQHIDAVKKVKLHINLTLTSFIEAEIEKWEGEKKQFDPDTADMNLVDPDNVDGFNYAISSVIEHLQEIKKQII